MPYFFFVWTDRRIQHLAEHGVTPDEFEEVVCSPISTDVSRTTGRQIAFGYTSDGKYLACVYEFADDDTILPVTAYEPDGE